MFRFLVCATLLAYAAAQITQAVVNINSDPITGKVTFTKTNDGIKIQGAIAGLAKGKHGFHIHEKGDLGDKCAAAGPHLNPEKKDHGAPSDDNRHVGDLGNIVADDNKVANIDLVDKVISFEGSHSIIGRALVIHELEDDLGRGTSNLSKTTGNAGGRLTCGVVGIADGSSGGSSLYHIGGFLLLLTTFILTKIIL